MAKSLFIYLILAIGVAATNGQANFESLKESSPSKLKIGSSDCEFDGVKNGCNVKYTKVAGLCSFDHTVGQLFSGITLSKITKNFVVPEKLYVDELAFDTCSGKNDVQFKLKAKESYEIASRYLVLAAESTFVVGWKHTDSDVTLERMRIEVAGKTSVGNDHQVSCTFSKPIDKAEFEIAMPMASVSVTDFLAKFGTNADELQPISDSGQPKPGVLAGMEPEKSRLGINSINFQQPEIKGIFAPGQGYEIICKGTVPAPALLKEAHALYIIVQDFKKADSSEVEEVFDTPSVAIFADYRQKSISDIIFKMTGQSVPATINIIEGRRDFCLVASTRTFSFINTESMRNQVEKFSPKKGVDLIEPGLRLIHFSPNANPDIKDENGKKLEKILFRARIEKEQIKWITPERVETTVKEIAGFGWEKRGINRLAIKRETKAAFDQLDFDKNDKGVRISFNLTQPVPVLDNGLLTLLNSTIILVSMQEDDGGYGKWALSGKGKEVILEELVEIEIKTTETSTVVRANSEVYNMATIRNRTKADYLPPEYVHAFNISYNFDVFQMFFDAHFEIPEFLRLKGKADFGIAPDSQKPDVEVILYTKPEEGFGMKVGVEWINVPLNKIVNTLYENQTMQSTWITCSSTTYIFKKEKTDFEFEKEFFNAADKYPTFDSGIGIVCKDLDLSVCGTDDKKVQFCEFLKTRYGDKLSVLLRGFMRQHRTFLDATLDEGRMKLGDRVNMNRMELRIETSPHGDRLAIEGNLHFTRYDEMFPGAKIVLDGSNNLLLKVVSERGSAKLFDVPYVAMRPLRILYDIPTDFLEHVEFRSRLHIGSVEEYRMEFPGGDNSRQYVGLAKNPYYKLYAVRDGPKLKNILRAFGIASEPDTLIKGAKFDHKVIAAYNSLDETWEVPEGDFKIKKGFFFIGKLTLKSGNIYDTRCKLTESLGLKCTVQLKPMEFGQKKLGKKRGEPAKVQKTLKLYRKKDEVAVGPRLIVEISQGGGTQRIEGYGEVFGLEGPFVMSSEQKGKKTAYSTQLSGKFQNEIDDVTVYLSGEGEGLPMDMDITYKLDLTQHAATRAGDDIKEALKKVQKESVESKKKAQAVLDATNELYNDYDSQIKQSNQEMINNKETIERNNEQVDQAVFAIYDDCISTCKTVPLGGLEWKEDCVQSTGGRNMKCLSWNEAKEKVVNVICMLKCEAKKLAASNSAMLKIKENRLLLNKYKEAKVLYENLNKVKSIIKESQKIASDTKEMIEEKTNFEDKLTQLLAKAQSGDLASISLLKVERSVNTLNPPCPEFDLDFTLNAVPVIQHRGLHPICFNGEFFKNVGVQILRSSFPKVDSLYKAMEEAELRYVQIEEIKKSALRSNKKMRTDKKIDERKKSHIKKNVETVYDSIEKQLLEMTERRMPMFTTRSDRTMMGFLHYSPWAVARRSHPFASVKKSDSSIKYKPESIQGKPCHRASQVVGEYRSIVAGLRHVVKNYKKGKIAFNEERKAISADLEDSFKELSHLANKTALDPHEVKDMFHWYDVTRQGMEQWSRIRENQIASHNKRGLSFWRSDVQDYYGSPQTFGHLHEIVSHAYSRSNVPDAKKSTTEKALSGVSQAIRDLLQNSDVTIEEAASMIRDLHVGVEELHKSAVSCF